MPLASTFLLSNKNGKEAYVEPVIENGSYRFTVKAGPPPPKAKNGTKMARGANFQCVMSGSPIAGDYIKAEGKSGRMGTRLMAIVADGGRRRIYLSPISEHETSARGADPDWKPEIVISGSTQYLGVQPYGMYQFDQLFTNRQLLALSSFSDLVGEARERIRHDSMASGVPDDGIPVRDGGNGATGYAEAVGLYLTFCVDRAADFSNSCTRWVASNEKGMNLFGKQAIAMTWDFPEVAILNQVVGGFAPAAEFIAKCISKLPHLGHGQVTMQNAMTGNLSISKIVSTDPPYYDNVPYADLSDFFYVWLRRSLRTVFPDLFATLSVPKVEELVAAPYRHGGKDGAETFFLNGMIQVLCHLAEQSHPGFPVTIYYAFKQLERSTESGASSTGWETFLGATAEAGFSITGTWPMRTESGTRMRGMDSNALASSIVLACRPRAADAALATRRGFLDALRTEMPEALRKMQQGNIAPVDLAQAAIGPGMAIFTRYARVLDAGGKAVSVREALALINETLDEVLAEQEGDFDADTRWALAWFEQSGFNEGEYGVAETLSTAKNTSVAGMVEAGILTSGGGNVRLLTPAELPQDWDPKQDSRRTVWETTHHLVRVHSPGGRCGRRRHHVQHRRGRRDRA